MSNIKQSNINILYIEDDLTVQESVSNILGMVVENIFLASDGEEALAILEKKNYLIDIIVTDIRMPKLNGLELVEIIRQKSKDIPVIITTAFNEINYLQKAINLKVDKFIQKPVNLKDLIDEVQKLINIISTKRELERKKIQLLNYKTVINLTNYVIEIDPIGNIKYISDNLKTFFKENLGFELEFKNLFHLGEHYDYKSDELDSKDKIRKVMFKKVLDLEIFTKHIVFNINENIFTFNMTSFASYIENDEVKTISIIFKDISEVVRKKDKQIEELYKDLVTELPNRHALVNELNKINEDKSLLLLNIDNFRKYKHTYGFDISDKILNSVADELKHYFQVRGITESIYKLENALFAITIKKEKDFDIEKSKEIANKLIEYFDKFVVTVDNLSIDISITLGTSCLGTTDLLLEAYIALDSAYSNKKHFTCYTELDNPQDRYIQNINMQRKVKKALAQDLMVPYFQPIVDKDKNVVKYESLARVIDPEDKNNILTPYFFLDVVQDSKIYEKFTTTIIKKAVESSLKLKKSVSINLSFEDITNPTIINYLESILKEGHPYPIVLEFLESEGLQDIDKTIYFCNIMKSYGAVIAIDDFGAGYSNYDYFFNIPFDILKLDGSLVKRVEDYRGFLLLESIITFAKRLNIQVVAEFVESEVIFEKLKTLDVDFFQGYYFDKAKSLEEILSSRGI